MVNGEQRRSSVFGATLLLFCGCFFLEYVSESLRYAKYALPFVALVMAAPVLPPADAPAVSEDTRWFSTALVLVILALGANLLTTLATGHVEQRFYEEIYFIVAPLLLARIIFPHLVPGRIPEHARLLALVVVVSFIVEVKGALFSGIRSPGSLLEQFITSRSETESGTSFVFGLLCLYFVFTGNRRGALVMALFLVLSFKRVAIGGATLVVVAYWVLRRARIDLARHRRLVVVAMVAVNACILIVTYELARGAFDQLIEKYTGLPANFLTMGRVRSYGLILSGGGITWVGHGLGHVTALLASSGSLVLNAHSDVLKYALELGPILSAVLIFQFYRLCSHTTETFLLMAYINVLFISDNVSIYFEVMFVFYVLHGFLVHRSRARGSAATGQAPSPSA